MVINLTETKPSHIVLKYVLSFRNRVTTATTVVLMCLFAFRMYAIFVKENREDNHGSKGTMIFYRNSLIFV